MTKFKKYLQLMMFPVSICLLLLLSINGLAQDSTAVAPKKAVKNTFEGNWIQDNQSVMVPIKGTLEMDMQHRFGTVKNGYKDLIGIYAPANIRIGFSYVVIDNLQLGFGFTKEKLQWDLNAKYALLKQTKGGGSPVSITYFVNTVIETRPDKENLTYVVGGDRVSYFHQLIIAHKLTDKISLQVSPSISHYNNVEGVLDEAGVIQRNMKNDHIAIAFMGRYKVSEKMNVMINYDQPITEHPGLKKNTNPNPNLSFGIELVTSAHAFQIFMGNYQGITPQSNNYFNHNSPFKYTAADGTKMEGGMFLIGFNITRLWNL